MKKDAIKKRKSDGCPYNIKTMNFVKLSKGLDTKTLAEMITAKFGKKAAPEREVFYIMRGERKRPNPKYILQIAQVLEIKIEEIIKAA